MNKKNENISKVSTPRHNRNRARSSFVRTNDKIYSDNSYNDKQYRFYEYTVNENMKLRQDVKEKNVLITSLIIDLNSLKSYIDIIDKNYNNCINLIRNIHDSLISNNSNKGINTIYQTFFPNGLNSDLVALINKPKINKYDKIDCNFKCNKLINKRKKEICNEVKKICDEILSWKKEYIHFKELFANNHLLNPVEYVSYDVVNMFHRNYVRHTFISKKNENKNIENKEKEEIVYDDNFFVITNEVNSIVEDDQFSQQFEYDYDFGIDQKDAAIQYSPQLHINTDVNNSNLNILNDDVNEIIDKKIEIENEVEYLSKSRDDLEEKIKDLNIEEDELKKSIEILNKSVEMKSDIINKKEHALNLNSSIALAEKDSLDAQYNSLKYDIEKLEIKKCNLENYKYDLEDDINNLSAISAYSSPIKSEIDKDKEIFLLKEKIHNLEKAYNRLEDDYNRITHNSSDYLVSDSIISSLDEIVAKYDI